MDKLFLKILVVSIAISLSLLCHAVNSMAEEEAPKEEKKSSLMERIDFGNSYILGQSIKSGAAYLLHRKKSEIKSMLKTREEYRKEILEDFKVIEDSEEAGEGAGDVSKDASGEGS